ncbi:MAG: hypothetical protein LBJ74_00270 [Heliobacteriaceae bacterium]|jgi:uncharacterized membrane protein|nr:hypothetical protein [Heliobacteriaceae bacterium]
MYDDEPYAIERIISSLSYLTAGLAGFIYLLIGLFTGARLRPFVQYHILQSIFLSIAYVLASILFGFLGGFLSIIPVINKIFAQIVFWLNMPALGQFSLIQACVYTVIIYLAISSFAGKYSYLPFVSDIINQNTRR